MPKDPKTFDIGQAAYRAETTFQPGPWVLRPEQWNEFSVVAAIPLGYEWVAGSVREQDAHLIAAAPDLYVELENQAEMLRIYSTLGSTPELAVIAATCATALVTVDAVLAKARGKNCEWAYDMD